ncbi:MAG TPA: hypothetical protein VF400_09120 [Anaeromyxobacteraceae bacterium]
MALDRRTAVRREVAQVERKALLFLAAVIVLVALGVGLGWMMRR